MFQFNPYALIMISAALICIALAVVIWRRRPGAGIIPFFVLLIGIAIWSLMNGLRLSVTNIPLMSIFNRLTFLGVVTVPTTFLVFVLAYTGRDRWLTRRNLIILTIVPTITFIVILTNPLHQFFWDAIEYKMVGPWFVLESHASWAFWIHAFYSYLMLVIAVALLLRSMLRSPQLYRGQVNGLIVGGVAPWIANAIYIFGYSPLPDFLDLTPLAFTFLGVVYAWMMYRYRFMDIVPVAKDLVMDSIADSVIVVDQQNRIVDVNKTVATILGVPRPDIIGRPAAEVLSNQGHLVEKFQDVEETTEEISTEVLGQPITFNMQISPVRNRQGEVTGRVIVLHDITALKKTNEELIKAREKAEEANQLKTQFLTTMSHELRTPLNAISGFTELLLTGMTGELNDIQKRNLERIFANTSDLRRLIDDMLDLAKIESGRMELIRKRFVIEDWLQQIEEQTTGLAKEKGLTYTLVVEDILPKTIVGDPDRLKQVVINLISNAIKFTDNGEVTVELKRLGTRQWTLSVADTGIGIAPHEQEVIFDRFRQVDGSYQRKHGGTGLGLAIVRELTLMMGGSVRVRSKVDEGSTFTILLPLVTEATKPEESSAQES